MARYQQFRLDNQQKIWAESLQQAQQRWPGQHPVPVAAAGPAGAALAERGGQAAGAPAPVLGMHAPVAPPARVAPPPRVVPPPPVQMAPLPRPQPDRWAGMWNPSDPAGAIELMSL